MADKLRVKSDTTYYSDDWIGDRGNYDWSVNADWCRGYIGVNQKKDDGTMERVLLSPRQTRELVEWLKQFPNR